MNRIATLLEKAQQNPNGLKFNQFERLMRGCNGRNVDSEVVIGFGILPEDRDYQFNRTSQWLKVTK